MTHRCIAVVHNPHVGPGKAVVDSPTEIYEFEVGQWYEALDMLTHLIFERHPYMPKAWIDDHEVRAMSMIKIED